MSAITYKCPNCPSALKLDPKTQRFVCDYCQSSFSIEELKGASPKAESNADKAAARLYHCQNCGAEVFTDDTTAATFCVYCHSPVVLSGQLAGEFMPDQVIPFSVEKESVTKEMMNWCKKKRFIDDAFFDQAQVEKLSGVYFPYFIVDGKTKGSLRRQGQKVKVWTQGDYRYTQTDTYQIEREGEIAFEDIPINALSKDHTYILSGIQPFNQKKAIPFSMPYLSGFLADKRNVSQSDVMPEVKETAAGFTSRLLNETVTAYSNYGPATETASLEKTVFSYVLMPAWLLTYRFGKEQYYFAMNGESGKIAGRVPLSQKKLSILFGAVTASVFALMMALGWML